MSIYDESAEQRTPHFSSRTYISTVILSALCFGGLAMYGMQMEGTLAKIRTDPAYAFGVGVAIFGFGFIAGSFIYFPTLLFRRVALSLSTKTTAVELIRKSSEDLQGAIEQDFVTHLVRINFKYIDAYYLQTQIQADKSFTFALGSACVSLGLIMLGITLSFFDKINAATVATGAGILGEFISAVFFYLYNQTVAKMAEYHRKLVFTQNIGLALKISDGLPSEEKTKAQLTLIDTLSKDINQHLG